jgi:ppGpp synthetase/RelA/SpoT-type nucleotidyltranferase
LPLLRDLETEARYILQTKLKTAGVVIHEITSRVKDVDSLREKLSRLSSEDKTATLDDVLDQVGLRVIYLFLSDIPSVCALLRESFNVIHEDNKIEDSEVSSFGYMSAHFIAQIPEYYRGSRYDKIKDTCFEIQVRTIAMHAWASVSHHLMYKTPIDVPKELKRDFFALSGLFYVADTHFEMLIKSKAETQKRIGSLLTKGEAMSGEINLDSLTEYLRRKLPDRRHAESESISELVSELSNAGYRSISDIENAFESAGDAFLIYEKDSPPLSKTTGEITTYTDVGVIRGIFDLVDGNFHKLRGGLPGAQSVIEKYRRLMRGDK